MPPALGNRVGRGAYKDFVENGLAVVRDRDEVFLPAPLHVLSHSMRTRR